MLDGVGHVPMIDDPVATPPPSIQLGAYFNIWVGLCFVPGSWNCLFKTGPIA
jgi:hypothetical protein